MIIDQEILDEAASNYEDNSHYPCGEIEAKERAFKAGARWAEERMMRFVPWDYNMPENVKMKPLIPDEMSGPLKIYDPDKYPGHKEGYVWDPETRTYRQIN